MTESTKASPPRWSYLPFRIAITASALLLFDQAVFAGQFLSGTFGSLQTHRDNGIYSAIAVLVAAACAVLVWRPGRGPIWPLFACLGLFALIAVQIRLGFARTLTVHIPLGVAIIVLAALLVISAWRVRPALGEQRPARGRSKAQAGPTGSVQPRLAQGAGSEAGLDAGSDAGSDAADETRVRA